MKVRIGTRASELALAQTQLVSEALKRAHPGIEIEVIHIKTLGDQKQGTIAAAVSDKKEWVLELELALLADKIDLAVHSGKDVPYEIEKGTELLPILERESPFDVFVGNHDVTLKTLEPGAQIGTASLRRQAELKRLRPDVKIVEHRGNVPTRIKKLFQNPELSGIVLAEAGLQRLDIHAKREVFDADDLMPAINQGILTAQFCEARKDLRELIQPLIHQPTLFAFQAERACVSVLGADCHSAVGIFAELQGGQLVLSSRVLLPDGSKFIEASESAATKDAAALGTSVGKKLLAEGAAQILESSRRQS